jgi:hypothetical protein
VLAALGLGRSWCCSSGSHSSQTRAFGAVSPVGVFSSVRSTQEHAYGYSVQLWKDDGRLFGLFSAFDGPVGDAPVGLIDDVQYNSKDGKLHFQAKLTTGVVTK